MGRMRRIWRRVLFLSLWLSRVIRIIFLRIRIIGLVEDAYMVETSGS